MSGAIQACSRASGAETEVGRATSSPGGRGEVGFGARLGGGAGLAAALDRTLRGEAEMDALLGALAGGALTTPSELLMVQGVMYRSMQRVELTTRVLDRMVSAWKQLASGQI